MSLKSVASWGIFGDLLSFISFGLFGRAAPSPPSPYIPVEYVGVGVGGIGMCAPIGPRLTARDNRKEDVEMLTLMLLL